MNFPTQLIHRFTVTLLLCAACVSGSHVLRAAPATNAPAGNTTNAPAGTNTLRLSLFDADSPSGKDPFFPRSTRRALELSSSASGGAPADTSALSLQGVSGSGARAFATINNRTFQTGEEGEVLTPSGRFRIRCVEIKAQSVVVSLGASQRLELRLPQR